MKTVSLKQSTKDLLDEYGDGLSNNKAIGKLLDESDPPSEVIEVEYESYNIKVDEDTYDRLLKYRKYSNESLSNIVLRLLMEKM